MKLLLSVIALAGVMTSAGADTSKLKWATSTNTAKPRILAVGNGECHAVVRNRVLRISRAVTAARTTRALKGFERCEVGAVLVQHNGEHVLFCRDFGALVKAAWARNEESETCPVGQPAEQ